MTGIGETDSGFFYKSRGASFMLRFRENLFKFRDKHSNLLPGDINLYLFSELKIFLFIIILNITKSDIYKL